MKMKGLIANNKLTFLICGCVTAAIVGTQKLMGEPPSFVPKIALEAIQYANNILIVLGLSFFLLYWIGLGLSNGEKQKGAQL